MWRQFIDVALAKLPEEHFAEPKAIDPSIKPILQGQLVSVSSFQTDPETGESVPVNLATLTGSMHNILHYVEKRNPLGPYPTNPANDSQYGNWEYAVQNWVQGAYGSLLDSTASSTGASDIEPEVKPNDDDTPTEINGRNRRKRNN